MISNDSPPSKSSRHSRSRPGSIATPELETSSRQPLRVALDARALTDDATGVGRYIGALIRAFHEIHGVDLKPYRDPGLRILGPQVELPLRLRRDGAQPIRGPANALPLLPPGLPGVVTIHDLAIYDHPEWFPSGQWFATRVVVPQSARGARIIICPSETTKRATVRLFGIEPDYCRVIPHGVETEFSLPLSATSRAEVATRYALPHRYLLQVGTVQPRKNYVTTLRALKRIPATQRIPLLVVGGFGWKYDDVVQAVAELELRDWVRLVGYAARAG